MTTSLERNLRVRVICSPLPPTECGQWTDITIGMQHGQEVHAPDLLDRDRAVFETELRIRPDLKTGAPDFRGACVHGPLGGRFLYLNWLAGNEHSPTGFSRIKIQLSSITWELLNEAGDGGLLEVRVSGVGKNGRPAAATVPLLDGGWQAVRA